MCCFYSLTHHFFCFMLLVDEWTDVDRRRGTVMFLAACNRNTRPHIQVHPLLLHCHSGSNWPASNYLTEVVLKKKPGRNDPQEYRLLWEFFQVCTGCGCIQLTIGTLAHITPEHKHATAWVPWANVHEQNAGGEHACAVSASGCSQLSLTLFLPCCKTSHQFLSLPYTSSSP